MSPVNTSNSVKCVSPPLAFGDPSAFWSFHGTVIRRVPSLWVLIKRWLTKYLVAPLLRKARSSAVFKAVWKETGIRIAFSLSKNTLLWNTARVKAVLLRLGKNPPPLLRPSSRCSRSRILVSEGYDMRVSHVSVYPACRISEWMKSRPLSMTEWMRVKSGNKPEERWFIRGNWSWGTSSAKLGIWTRRSSLGLNCLTRYAYIQV